VTPALDLAAKQIDCAFSPGHLISPSMNVTVIYYLDVTSSWCSWAEPAWAELKQRYAPKPVEFSWRIALLDEPAIPVSKAQLEWFYRRSGFIVRSPFMLNAGWFEAGAKEFLAPNAVAEAARDFGVNDDRVRLAIAAAALRDGQKVLSAKVSATVAAKASGLDAKKLLAGAQSPAVEKRVRAATAEFHALQVTQRPTFVLTNNIGDRAVFSGLTKTAPVAATIDAMLEDAAGYASHAAHFGEPPPH
jgi:predicted DsbA family dithiol-disulfide isomerase